MHSKLTLKLLGIVTMLFFTSQVFSQIHLLSGLEGGTYDALASDIAKLSKSKIKVSTSHGSVDNYKQLMADNDVFITFLQYDVLLANEMINPEIKKQLRVYFPFFLDEEIHLICKEDSEIKSLEDIKGLKVGVGKEGQGTLITSQMIKNKTGISWTDVRVASNAAYDALMNGDIDAFFYVGGIPVNSLSKLGADAKIKMVNLNHKSLQDVYSVKKIKKGTYPWQSKTVKTLAVPTIMVIKIDGLSKEDEVKANELRSMIQENMDRLQEKGHEKWKAVYIKNQRITWPYYYQKQVVK